MPKWLKSNNQCISAELTRWQLSYKAGLTGFIYFCIAQLHQAWHIEAFRIQRAMV